jgi:phosphate transport system substrate-binding protein
MLLMLSGCGGGQKEGQSGPQDTFKRGHIQILADETLKPLTRAQIEAYETTYPDAHINVKYLPESKAFRQFTSKDDTSQALVAARKLQEGEIQRMKENVYGGRRHVPAHNKFAKDGVVAVVHPSNPDTFLTLEQIQKMLTGQARRWGKVGKQRPGGGDSIVVVFDHGSSSTRRFMSDSVLQKGQELSPEVAFSAGGNQSVIDYVAKNENAIGFLGLNYLSDKEDSAVKARLKQVQPVELPDQKHTGDFIQPMDGRLPVYLRDNRYPLTRTVYYIRKVTRDGLAQGIETFIAGSKGARIAAKMGLFPAQPMSRQIQIKEGPVPQ